jgi:hypothetical protein
VRPFRAFPSLTPGNGNPVSGSKDNAPATPEEAAVQAARQLAIHVWDPGKTVTLQQLSLQIDDPNLLIAMALGWLKVGDERQLLRGKNEPRPAPEPTRIPN